MSVYLQKGGQVIPFQSTEMVDYQVALKSGWTPTTQEAAYAYNAPVMQQYEQAVENTKRDLGLAPSLNQGMEAIQARQKALAEAGAAQGLPQGTQDVDWNSLINVRGRTIESLVQEYQGAGHLPGDNARQLLESLYKTYKGGPPPPNSYAQLGIAPSAAAAAPTGTALATTRADGLDTTGWTDAMIKSYDALHGYVKTLQSQGKRVNPSITITPEMTAKFLEQAKTELNPYFSQIISQGQADVKRAFERTTGDLERRQRDIGLQYGTGLEAAQESFARRGLTFSTQRERAEQNLSAEASRALSDAEEQARRQAEAIGTAGERELGTSLFPAATASTARQGITPILNQPGIYGLTSGVGTRALFTPIGGTTGDIERTRLFEEEQRVKGLRANERELRSEMYL